MRLVLGLHRIEARLNIGQNLLCLAILLLGIRFQLSYALLQQLATVHVLLIVQRANARMLGGNCNERAGGKVKGGIKLEILWQLTNQRRDRVGMLTHQYALHFVTLSLQILYDACVLLLALQRIAAVLLRLL